MSCKDVKLSAASAPGHQTLGKKKKKKKQEAKHLFLLLSFCNPMANSSVTHLVFYLHFNVPCDYSRAWEALEGYTKSSCFHLIAMVGRRGPWSVSLTPFLPCLSLSFSLALHLPLSLCTPQRVLSDRIKSVWAVRPPLPTCVCARLCVWSLSCPCTETCSQPQGFKKNRGPSWAVVIII